ncbi:hypothetical protein FPV67DRAFT_1419227 [Lyophyllum atratum]|nr:hypothetical protein FPV67DRAFT_1419227 [Lyophyllum atratum]
MPFEGMVGSLVNDGHQIVLSPNVCYTFEPPLGTTREMKLRKDFRYGMEDPLCGPQPYVVQACHLAAIPRRPANPDDPLNIMWKIPTTADFVIEPSNMLRGVGFLTDNFAHALGDYANRMNERITKYSTDPNFPTKIPVIASMSHTQMDMLDRIYELPMSLRQVQFCVSLFQRCYLELVGFLDYLYIFHPRMTGLQPLATGVADAIGAYVQEHAVIHEFVRAGLPVWIVKDWESFTETRIDEVVPVCKTPTWAVFEDATPPFQPFFVGPASNWGRYKVFGRFARSFLSFPDPFASTPSIPSPASIPASSGPVRGRLAKQNKSNHPCKHFYTPLLKPLIKQERLDSNSRATSTAASSPSTPASSGPSRSGRNKFTEPFSPFLPPAIEAWRDALEVVDVDPANVCYATTPADAGYILPEPGLFIGVSSEDRRTHYIHNWLRNRAALLFRLVAPNANARPISVSLWRTLLNFGAAPDDRNRENAAHHETLARKRHDEIISILGNAVTETGVEVNSSTVVPSWKGEKLLTTDPLRLRMVHEILWELYDLNFRSEFVALDCRISTLVNTPLQDRRDILQDRRDLIRACFPLKHSTLDEHVSRDAEGLAAVRLSGRAPYLLAMVKVMKSWVGCPPSLKDLPEKPSTGYREFEIAEVERVVTRFYTQSFFNYFARAPVVPHRLGTPE